ncbi:MAG: efflux RND transporter permease subunit [Pseudomonadota bacterium]
MKHTRLALSRPVGTVMIFIALGLVGFISARQLSLEYLPDIQFPGLFVQIPYAGSTPEEIEERITRPVEEVLATLSGVKRIESTTTQDQAEIFLEFDWDTDASAGGIEARSKIDAIRDELPADIQRILVFTGSLGDQPILQLRISSERDLSDAYTMLERELKRPIERLPGVSRVELQGVEPREIRILLDSDRVAAYGVDLGALVELLRKSNFAVNAGRITDGGRRLSLRPQGEFRSLDDVRNIAVNGSVRLGDIANVRVTAPERDYGRHLNGTYAIGLAVFKETEANMVDVAERVVEEVERIGEKPMMRGVSLFELENQADGVKTSLADVLRSGLIGALLAIAVLYLFLRQLSTTLIVTLSVPFSLLITLGVMYFSGLTLNILTMMGLMLAVGMLVDNAVVVTESVFKYRQEHPDEPPTQATIKGVRNVGIAVLAGTATSVIVFLPILFGIKAEITIFLSHMAITIVASLVASLIIAQTLVPMLAARVAPPPQSQRSSVMRRLTDLYVRLLDACLRRPWLSLFAIVVIVVSVAIPAKVVTFDMWPEDGQRRLMLHYHVDGVYPVERTEALVNDVEAFLDAHREEFEIRDVYSYFDTVQAQSSILLSPREEAVLSAAEIRKRIEDGLPTLAIAAPSFEQNRQGGSEGFSLQLSGDSMDVLAPLTDELVRALASIDGLTNIRSDVRDGDEEVRIVVDRERAMKFGLSAQTVASSVATAMRGENLREFRGTDGDVDMRLAFRDTDKSDLESLRRLPLFAADGEQISLAAVADLQVVRGARRIKRVDRATAAVISADLRDLTLDEVKPRVESLMAQFDLPPGYKWKFGRGFSRNDETGQIMLVNTLLGIASIFLVMAALFESTLLPMSIITSIVFSIIGVFWFFMLTGTSFSFMATIGILILIGVVVNNGIVLVDHINNLRLEGVPRRQAILDAGRDRLRPILMTVATTVLGLLPLAVGDTQVGGNGPPYYPMARAIIGGLVFSTVTSLLIVPRVYVWFDQLDNWWRMVIRTAFRTARTA